MVCYVLLLGSWIEIMRKWKLYLLGLVSLIRYSLPHHEICFPNKKWLKCEKGQAFWVIGNCSWLLLGSSLANCVLPRSSGQLLTELNSEQWTLNSEQCFRLQATVNCPLYKIIAQARTTCGTRTHSSHIRRHAVSWPWIQSPIHQSMCFSWSWTFLNRYVFVILYM